MRQERHKLRRKRAASECRAITYGIRPYFFIAASMRSTGIA
jgi:hypothetical protein